jgi:hypothetical protein
MLKGIEPAFQMLKRSAHLFLVSYSRLRSFAPRRPLRSIRTEMRSLQEEVGDHSLMSCTTSPSGFEARQQQACHDPCLTWL